MTGAIERVIVTLDAASENRTAIDTAARLAARADVPLHGIFVEDEDLINLATLPFARQITLWTGAQALTLEHAELNLRAAAEQARRDLLSAARRYGVQASFEIVRGSAESALSGVSERDLVVACAQTRPIAGHFRVEGRWWSSVDAAPGPFLLTRRAWNAVGGIVLLLRDRGPAAARLVAAAVQIAEAGNSTLTVIVPSADAAEFEAWIADQMPRRLVQVQIEIAPADPSALQERVGQLNCRLLAVDASIAEDGSVRLREFVQRFTCDVMIGH